MDWSALLGALIGAAAGVLGSFVSSWAQFRKDRLAFNRDRVTSVAFQYLRDCDKLLDAKEVQAIVKADCARRGVALGEKRSEENRVAVVSASRAAETDLGELAILCPKAFKKARALYYAAHSISEKDISVAENGQEMVVDDAAEERYSDVKTAFIKRIRKSTDL